MAAVVMSLAACGGGGGDDTPTPTALPDTLSVTVPTKQQALGAVVAFGSNAADPSTALKYEWQFGDKEVSTLANPTHAFAKPGLYTVTLTLTNEAGVTRTATSEVAVADLAIVQGKSCSGADLTGWCWQRPLPQGNAINDYTFIDDSRGWAVGDAGTVMVTSDGGVSWRAQTTGTDLMLRKVAFSSPQVGWIVATSGQLLKTANGGQTWQLVSFGSSESVASIGSSDADTAWLSTSSAVYVTTSGGSQWKRIGPPDTNSYWTLTPVSNTDIWAGPGVSGVFVLKHSLDGGASWSDVALPAVEAGLSRYVSSFQINVADGVSQAVVTASDSGYLAGTNTYVSRQVMWRTKDAGASWQPLTLPPAFSLYGAASFSLFDANTVIAFLPYYNGAAQRSTDGGATWQAVAAPTTSSYITSYRVFSAQRMLATDGGGLVYLTTDGGAHWATRAAAGPAVSQLNSVWFFNARDGLGVGTDGTSVRTSDGGQSWQATASNGYYSWRRAQFSPNGSLGWVISDTGAIYRSSDAGKTWLSPVPQTSTPLLNATDFHFTDDLNGWAVAPYPYSYTTPAAIFHTVDGGFSWQPVEGTSTLYGFDAIRFADAAHGVTVGPAGTAMVTTDGGVTWQPRPTGIEQSLRRIVFIDAKTALAVGDGGAIVRSTDQGQSWSRIQSPTANPLNDVRFVSASLGWAVGDNGTVLVTRDGGLSWTQQASGTHVNLQAVFFTDERGGWIVGDNGLILATVSGGTVAAPSAAP